MALTLYPFQQEAIAKAHRAPLQRWVFNFEMGLGKTPTALVFCQTNSFDRVLVITPAIVRSHWRDELATWWPESAERGVGIINVGKARKSLSKKKQAERDGAFQAQIQIVSYALLSHVEPIGWDCIIIDEAHRCKAPNSKQTEAVRTIVDANPGAAVLGLTGTLMPNDITDVWATLDIIWPGRFGEQTKRGYVPYKFAARYALKEVGDYGTQFYGLNPEHKDELAYRLGCLSSRVTKQEVAHLLPAFQVKLLKVQADNQVRFNTLQEWEDGNGQAKIPQVIEWYENTQATHVCIATNLRATARAIAARIPNAVLITGDSSPEERNRLLTQCKAAPRAVVVCTYHSVGIGIDLTFCTEALIVEMFPRPETILQFLGRFSRLSGKLPSSVDVMCFEGTVDQRMAELLLEKVRRINEAIPPGVSDTKLSEALDSVGDVDEDKLLADLSLALEGVDFDSL